MPGEHTLTQEPPQPFDVVAAVMQDTDVWLDQHVVLKDANPEVTANHYFKIYDIVNKHNDDGSRTPVAILQTGEHFVQMPVKELFERKVPQEGEPQLAPRIGESATETQVTLEPVTSTLDAAKQAWENKSGYDYLFDNDQPLSDALSALTPIEKRQFENWQVEQGAIRPKRFYDILKDAPKAGNNVPKVAAENTSQLRESIEALGARGVFVDKPDEASIEAGIKRAQDLVKSGRAEAALRSMPFVSHEKKKKIIESAKSTQPVWLDEPLYIDPTTIESAESFESWLGRGRDGTGEVAKRSATRGTRHSKAQILDYASRDTQLPALDETGGASIVISNEGVHVFASNSHRAAAAKLRNEPIGVKAITIYRV
jgi:hypothetical protein